MIKSSKKGLSGVQNVGEAAHFSFLCNRFEELVKLSLPGSQYITGFHLIPIFRILREVKKNDAHARRRACLMTHCIMV